MTFTPRGNKGTKNLKVKITSQAYPSNTLTTLAFTVTVAGDCALTALTIPGSHSVADTEYEVHAGAT